MALKSLSYAQLKVKNYQVPIRLNHLCDHAKLIKRLRTSKHMKSSIRVSNLILMVQMETRWNGQ